VGLTKKEICLIHKCKHIRLSMSR